MENKEREERNISERVSVTMRTRRRVEKSGE